MAQHFFDTDIATEYGVNCAIIFQNLGFWIDKNEANERHFYDGRYWTYNSVKAFEKLFPYLSAKQISNTLKKLEEYGLIMSGNYNKSAYDRTKWYAFTDKGNRIYKNENSILPNGKMEELKKENGNTEKGEPIPYINADISSNVKSDNKEKKRKENTLALFDRLKDNYNLSETLKEKIREWLQYKQERKEQYKETGLKSLLKQIQNKVSDYGEEAICNLIDDCMANNWKGIIWDRINLHNTYKPKSNEQAESAKEDVAEKEKEEAERRAFAMKLIEEGVI